MMIMLYMLYMMIFWHIMIILYRGNVPKRSMMMMMMIMMMVAMMMNTIKTSSQ